jgi:hypothetical protein
MKNNLASKITTSFLAGLIGVSAILGSGCAALFDPRCKDAFVPVTSNKDFNGGVNVKLFSLGYNKVIYEGRTPCTIPIYRNGDIVWSINPWMITK